MENRRLAEVQAILTDPTEALLAALGLPRVCPRLDRAVGLVLRQLTHEDVPVWDDWRGVGEEFLQVDFTRQDEHVRSVIYFRWPRPEGGFRYAVDVVKETWEGQEFRSELCPNVRTDEQFGEAIWPLPY
jgi:hypothetical protein